MIKENTLLLNSYTLHDALDIIFIIPFNNKNDHISS